MKPVGIDELSGYLTDELPAMVPANQAGVYSFYREGPAMLAELRMRRRQVEEARRAMEWALKFLAAHHPGGGDITDSLTAALASLESEGVENG